MDRDEKAGNITGKIWKDTGNFPKVTRARKDWKYSERFKIYGYNAPRSAQIIGAA